MRTVIAACVVAFGVTLFSPLAATAQPASCAPVFTPIDFFRGLPHVFAEQALESMPRLYPAHLLLAQRRLAQAGPVAYSLLVYRKDAGDAVTIEGVGVHESRAWRFSATCASRLAWDGLVTTLERVAELPRVSAAPAPEGRK